MLKNYTSTVSVGRSVQHIEDCLVRHGARNIMKEYDNQKRLAGIAFIIGVEGRDMPFRLPARAENCEKILKGAVRRPKEGTYDRIREQAERTAWKIVSDWIDVQMSLIELEQAEFLEIFLPYVYFPESRQTFFQRVKEGGFKMLPERT